MPCLVLGAGGGAAGGKGCRAGCSQGGCAGSQLCRALRSRAQGGAPFVQALIKHCPDKHLQVQNAIAAPSAWLFLTTLL